MNTYRVVFEHSLGRATAYYHAWNEQGAEQLCLADFGEVLIFTIEPLEILA